MAVRFFLEMASKEGSEEEEIKKYASNSMEKTIGYFSILVKELEKDDDCDLITTYVVLSAYKKMFADLLISTKMLDSKEVGSLGPISIRLAAGIYQQFVKDIT